MWSWLLACGAPPVERSSPAAEDTATTPACESWQEEVEGTYWESADACVSSAPWDSSIQPDFTSYVLAAAPEGSWTSYYTGPFFSVLRCPAQDGRSYDTVFNGTSGVDSWSMRWAVFDPDTHEMLGSGRSQWQPDSQPIFCCEGASANDRIDGAALDLNCAEPDHVYTAEDFGLE